MAEKSDRVELSVSEEDLKPSKRKELYPETQIKVVKITPRLLVEMKEHLINDRKAWSKVGDLVVSQIALDSEFLEKVLFMTKVKRDDVLKVV